MANKIMKTLTIGSNTYEIVDEQARTDLTKLESSLATVAKSGSYNDLSDKPEMPNLADVATSGDYNDLLNKPTNFNDVIVDASITPDGINPVTGGAIYAALAGKANLIRYYTATFTVADWVGDTPPYTQTVNVEGLKSTDNPMADISLSDEDTAETADLKIASWSLIGRLVTGDDTLTAYCYGNTPEIEINVRLAVM